MNPLAMLVAAQRCNAAYIEDLSAVTAAFTQLGMSVIGQYQNLTHQCVLSKDSTGLVYLTIAGTRISEGNNLDLLDDVWMAPVAAPKGGVVSSGVFTGMADLWNWVFANTSVTTVINVEGHSLGAERALLTPLFLPKERLGDLYAFEAPMCATQEYWDAYREELMYAILTVCGNDRWYAWPPGQGYVHDAHGEVVWFQPTQVSVIPTGAWPGTDLDMDDHDIELLISRIQSSIDNSTFPH
jgi:hypothetical protein